MYFDSLISEELNFEKKLLQECLVSAKGLPDVQLIYSVSGKGHSNFYYRKKRSKRRIYIKKSQTEILRKFTHKQYLKQKMLRLRFNILLLEELSVKFMDYSNEGIIKALPDGCQKAIAYLDENDCTEVLNEDVYPSENPFRQQDLIHMVSNGLNVRSKNELLIAEMLLRAGVSFRYEKALLLELDISEEDGYSVYGSRTVYPDFTIYLADGTVIYWEHAGLMSDPEYRKRHFEKIALYHENGIYEPKNLIVTMDGPDGSFDVMAINKIIQDRILNAVRL